MDGEREREGERDRERERAREREREVHSHLVLVGQVVVGHRDVSRTHDDVHLRVRRGVEVAVVNPHLTRLVHVHAIPVVL